MLKSLNNIFQRLLPNRTVTYGSQFFQETWFSEWELLKSVLQQLIYEIQPNCRIIDFGCGPGVMIDIMNEAGFYYVGCDYSPEAKKLYLDRFGRYTDHYVDNLDVVNHQRFDLLLSFDVFEHMTDEQIEQIIFATQSVPVLFVNISRNRRTPGHINIKNDKQWISFFSERGLAFDQHLSEQVRNIYRLSRPGCPDHWDKNMFIFRRPCDHLPRL